MMPPFNIRNVPINIHWLFGPLKILLFIIVKFIPCLPTMATESFNSCPHINDMNRFWHLS